jgi:hypothetical protein
MENRFDELAKELARSMPRREMLGRLGGYLAGGLLAFLGLAQQPAEAGRRCNIFCSNLFRNGPARAQCQQVCNQCNEDLTRVCASIAGTVCCSQGRVCEFGSCVPTRCGACITGNLCGGSLNCLCTVGSDDQAHCVDISGFAGCAAPTCTTNADCGANEICDSLFCCGDGLGRCVSLCSGG